MAVNKKNSKVFVVLTAVIGLVCALFVPRLSYSKSSPTSDDRVVLELSALGKRGDTVLRARGQVLDILQNDNACAAWFRETDPDPAEVFRSLHFELQLEGPSYVYGMIDSEHRQLFKHPWAAKSMQNAGQNSTIFLNANGPFFNRAAVVMQQDQRGMVPRRSGIRLLTSSSYEGNTPEAQISILLHELGHIIDRLPEDDDSWGGQSSQNSSEVHRHCKNEIHAAARNSPKGSI
jgi:hypothetical protein